MRFTPTSLTGAFLIEPELREDARGFFARTYCAREFQSHGLDPGLAQCSVSLSHKRGTVRGLHYQLPPACEVKLVRCTAGAIYDVIVDMRPDSPTYLQHFGAELTAKNHRAMYIPKMFAHGLQTLEDNTEVLYQISEYFAPGQATGVRFDDPKLKIKLPLPVAAINDKDLKWPLLA